MQRVAQLGEGHLHRLGLGPDQVCPRGYLVGTVQLGQNRPDATTKPVAHHGTTDSASDGIADPRLTGVGVGEVANPHGPATHPAATPTKGAEGRLITDRPDQADSRARPLRRRALMMARPARSDMRWRNPCRLARFLTFG